MLADSRSALRSLMGFALTEDSAEPHEASTVSFSRRTPSQDRQKNDPLKKIEICDSRLRQCP